MAMHRNLASWVAVISQNIRRIKARLDMTDVQIAKSAGLHRATFNTLLNGREPNPSLRSLVAVSAALDVHLLEIFSERYSYESSPTGRYLTLSDLLWDRFLTLAFEDPLEAKDDVYLRQRFEGFLVMFMPERVFTASEKEQLWNDRKMGARHGITL